MWVTSNKVHDGCINNSEYAVTSTANHKILISIRKTKSISSLLDKISGLCSHNDQLQNQINTTISSLNFLSKQAQNFSSNLVGVVDEHLNHEKTNLIS